MLSVASILWPTDGSEPSYKALEAAVELAQRFGAKLYALQVVQQVPTVTGTGFAPVAVQGFDIPLYEQEMIKAAETELQQTLKEKIPEDIVVEAQVKIGLPAETINDFAEEHGVEMIVMATHGRTGLSHFMLGSVAEKTIRQARVPTLIIPGAEED